MLKSKLLIPAVLLSALLPNAASAQAPATASVHVVYRDLNLQSPAGVKVLDRRIAAAIAMVCLDISAGSLVRQTVVSRCRTEKNAEIAAQRAAVLADAGRRNVELAATRPVR